MAKSIVSEFRKEDRSLTASFSVRQDTLCHIFKIPTHPSVTHTHTHTRSLAVSVFLSSPTTSSTEESKVMRISITAGGDGGQQEETPAAASGGEDFYEMIEAPKFVDLTAPDHYLPGNDRYWFCSRVGCDQKHEEEMDSEAIYKDFVLRVMAARSPNIKIRKVLCRKNLSTNVKCPQTVPAKPSKSRVSRMALLSSISKRIIDPKVKVKPLSKQSATPNEKTNSGVEKALTAPRNKKQVTNQSAFQSVRNLKAAPNAVTKNRVVAKTLVFHSPKKSARTKTSIDTPMRELCDGMKKLQITGEKKEVLGSNKLLASDALRKQLRGREVKSRFCDGLSSQNCKGQEVKPTKYLKKKNEEKSLQHPIPQEGTENYFSDMEIDEKSRNGSLEACCTSKSDEGKANGGPVTTTEVLKPSLDERKVPALSDTRGNDPNSLSNSNENSSGDDISKFEAPCGQGIEANDGWTQEGKMKLNLEKGTVENAHTFTSDDKENESEIMESDDKENSIMSDENREKGLDNGSSRKPHAKNEAPKGTPKVVTVVMSKPSKERSLTPCAQRMRDKKPKPTNPKPFRLRTDERGILKEANLEKNHHPASSNEVTSLPRLPGGSSQKTSSSIRKNGTPSVKKVSKQGLTQKPSTTPQRHTVSSQQKVVAPEKVVAKTTAKLGNSLKRAKPSSVRPLARPQRADASSTKMVSTLEVGQLGVIKESSPTILRPKEVHNTRETGPSSATKASVASRPSPQGKGLTTIPREPNFHSIHVPRSCKRRLA